MENITKTRQLKNEVCDKFTDYEKQLELEGTQRLSLESALQEEKENSRYLEKQLELEVTRRVFLESSVLAAEENSQYLEKQLKLEEENGRCYIKQLKLAEIQRLSLESSLKAEEENFRNYEEMDQKLTEQVATLTQHNLSLSEENAKMTMELRQGNDKVKSLIDDLNMKETLLNDLDNDYQKLLKEKAAFNKNYERLKVFVNDLTFPGTGNLDIVSDLDKTDDSVKENKRSYEAEVSSIHPATKRLKSIDPLASASDPNDVSAFDNAEENELLENSQPDCDQSMSANADYTNNGN